MGCIVHGVAESQTRVSGLHFTSPVGAQKGGCFPALWPWHRAPALPCWASGSSSVPWDGSSVVMRTEAAAAVSTLLGVEPLNMCSVTGLSGCSEDHSQHHRVAAERL